MAGSPALHQPGEPQHTLKRRDVLAITVGIVVGAGIFRIPALVAGEASSEAMLFFAWVAGGMLSIIGALCYAEMASAFPSMGGDYHFLRVAYGSRLAFFYGWARLAVIQTGSIALLAYILGDYLAAIAPLGPYGPSIYAAAAVIFIAAVNIAGIRQGAGMQRWLTVAQILGLAAIIVAGFSLSPAGAAPEPIPPEGAFGLMMVFVLLTYGGWSEAVYVSAELKDSPRRMRGIMVAGLLFVALLYLLVNLAFLNALGLSGMAQSDAVAAEVLRLATGDAGAAAISLLVAIAALTSANATAITGARTTCALGRSIPILHWVGRWNTRRGTPVNALIVQTGVALLLVIGGAFARDGFQMVVEYTAPVFWLFLLLVGLALFVLRRKFPDVPRPRPVPLYPVLPALFCLTSAYLVYSSLAYTGTGALVGIIVLLSGALLLPFLRPVAARETQG